MVLLRQSEAVVVGAVVKFPAAIVTGHGAADGFDAEDGGKAMRAGVGVVAFHPAAFEGQRVKRLFTGDAEIRAGGLPLGSVWIDPAAAAAFVCDEMSEFVFECAPEFFGRTFAEFWIEFDHAVRPPRAAGGGLHARIP